MPDITQRGQVKKDDSGVAVGWNFINLTSTSSQVVKATPGVIHTVTINKPVASEVITIYNNTTSTGSKIATISLPASLLSNGPITAIYDVAADVGIVVTTSIGTSDITISYI